MTLEEIDAALADWKAKLQLASDNLVALTQLTTYQRLRGEGGWPKAPLTGVTATRVTPALEGMGDLWSHYGLFTDLVNRATELRNSISWLMPSRKTLDEIEHLLTGPSIALGTVETPLAQRDLWTVGEVAQALTPRQLLDAMTRSFQTARDAVMVVDAAWNRLLPQLDAQDNEAATLERQAEALGQGTLPELDCVRQQIATLRTQLEQDPLGAHEQAEGITSGLQTVRSRLDRLAQERDRVRGELAEAQRLLDRLLEAHRQAKDVWADRMLKVQLDGAADCPRPLEDRLVDALAPWLAKLESTFQEGKWKPAHVGLEKWTGIAHGYLASAEAAQAANEVPLRERRDLRGLLDALQAKAVACGRAEDPELAALGRQAWQLLHDRPTPLARARQLVAEYEARLL